MKHRRRIAMSVSIAAVALVVFAAAYYNTSIVQADQAQTEANDLLLYNVSGHITMLRVHELGTGYGPGDDFIDGEVVIRLDSHSGRAFGFKLRSEDDRLAARQGMLDLLRDGFNHDWIVSVDYWIESGKNNGEIVRVWLTKPVEPEM